MELTQDFSADFDRIVTALRPGFPPIAFVRFGDGEMRIMSWQGHGASVDGWQWTSSDGPEIPHLLRDSLMCDLPDYHIGMPCPCHMAEMHSLATTIVRRPLARQTFSTIFVNANWRRWKRINLDHCTFVGCRGPVFSIPPTLQDPAWNRIGGIVNELLEIATGPILVAAGPMACVLIHEYWKASVDHPNRQTILDVGSANDWRFGITNSRKYMRDRRRRQQVCTSENWAGR